MTEVLFTIDQVEPLSGFMLVEMDDEQETTESGVLVKPAGAREHLYRLGTVLRGSPVPVRTKSPSGEFKCRCLSAPVPDGTRIMFTFFYGDRYWYRQFRQQVGRQYIFLKADDVILYDDVDREGRGLDDLSFSAAGRTVGVADGEGQHVDG